MPLDSSGLRSLLDNFERSAFRLETHQTYTIPSEAESVTRFLAGEPKPEGLSRQWHERVRANVAKGKTMQRAKLVKRPFTDYTLLLFEWSIPGNMAAGEDYRIVDVTDRMFDLPEQDFWIFDDSVVVTLNFNPDGTMRDRDLVDSADVSKYIHWRDVALTNSVPFSEYRT
ncbi:DUF6879 family protein [Kutzneria sp. NPDC052558]|uniref:DUF6879 family protein n=1 Tax=Kutzneria sp. NPDC052558 TaxID=3364121 RepID=UPI0037C94384